MGPDLDGTRCLDVWHYDLFVTQLEALEARGRLDLEGRHKHLAEMLDDRQADLFVSTGGQIALWEVGGEY